VCRRALCELDTDDRPEDGMKRRFWILSIALALILLALLGWTVEGIRWATTGSRRRRPALSPA
jgi:hypothetical protein